MSRDETKLKPRSHVSTALGLTDDARPDPETLPPLPGPFMYIDSPRNLSSEDVPWWCHAARQLCPPSSQRRYSYMGVSLIKGT